MSAITIETEAVTRGGRNKIKIVAPKIDEVVKIVHDNAASEYKIQVLVQRSDILVDFLTLKLESIAANGTKTEIVQTTPPAPISIPLPGSEFGFFIYEIKVGDNGILSSDSGYLPDSQPTSNNRVLTVTAFCGAASSRTFADIRVVYFTAYKPTTPTVQPAPTVTNASVDGAGNILTITPSVLVTGTLGFMTSINGNDATITYDAGTSSSSLYKFSIAPSVTHDDRVNLAYIPGDVKGAASLLPMSPFANRQVTNNVPQVIVPPTITEAEILPDGRTLAVRFSTAMQGVGSMNAGFSLAVGGAPVTISYLSGSPGHDYIFRLNSTVPQGASAIFLSYTPGIVTAVAPPHTGLIGSTLSVTNNSSEPPVILGATLDSDGLTLVVTANMNIQGHDGFTLTVNGGSEPITYVNGDGDSVYTFSLTNQVLSGGTALVLTYSYPATRVVSVIGNIDLQPITLNVTNNVP